MKQFVAGAQLIMEKIGQRFDPGNALQSGMAEFPKVGVEARWRVRLDHKIPFVVGEKAKKRSQPHAVAHGGDHPEQGIHANRDAPFRNVSCIHFAWDRCDSASIGGDPIVAAHSFFFLFLFR